MYNIANNDQSATTCTGPVVGSAQEGGYGYYLDSIQVLGNDDSNSGRPHGEIACTEEYMKSEQFYNTLKSKTELWHYNEGNYPTLDICLAAPAPKTTEITVENEKKEFDITIEIAENSTGNRDGGTTTGAFNDKYVSANGVKFIETVHYNQSNTQNVVITPSEGYRLVELTINGENAVFETDSEGICTLQAGYLSNIAENKKIVVKFEPKNLVLTINKVDRNGKPVEGAKFKVEQVDYRVPPENTIVGNLTGTGADVVIPDMSTNVNDALGAMTPQSGVTYTFVDQGDGTYKSNNNGRSGYTANSYMKIDLNGKTGTYVAVVNATVSCEANYDVGYATITTDNSSAPSFSTTNGRFMYISGTSGESNNYISTELTGGNVYYLYFGYKKDGSGDRGDDALTINSVNIYGASVENFGFTKQDGKYVSTNQGKENTTCTSYVPVDFIDFTGKCRIDVNAELSSSLMDTAYIYVQYEEEGSTITKVLMDYKHGKVPAEDYSIVVDGGRVYNLYFSYSREAGTDIDRGTDTLTINSVTVNLDDSEFDKKDGLITNSEGKAVCDLIYGVEYRVTETEAPEGYLLNTTPQTITLTGTEGGELTFVNQKMSEVVTHFILKGTGPERRTAKATKGLRSGTPVELVQSETQFGVVGSEYKTSPRLVIVDDQGHQYTLERDSNGQYVIPMNATGLYDDETIDVNYYYEENLYEYKVHYMYNDDEDESALETATAPLGTEINDYTDKNPGGYVLSRVENLPLTVSNQVSNNNIYIYYVNAPANYEVHYFYDGVEDTDKAELENSAFVGDEISTYVDKKITGYKLDKVKALDNNSDEVDLPLVVKAENDKNVINVYYVRDSFEYTVHYFYDEVEDPSKVGVFSALYGSEISSVDTEINKIAGYKVDRVKALNDQGEEAELPLIIKTDVSKNTINVYYVKDNIGYTVHYFYDGTEDESKKIESTAKFGSIIAEEDIPDKNITGYKKDRIEGTPLTISATASSNVVNVYYVKDSFGYTVHYFYDGTEDESKKIEDAALFGTVIEEVPDKNIPGYKKQKTEGLPLTISANVEENVVKVYYIKDELGYSVHYFYDNVEDETKTVNENATFGSVITEMKMQHLEA